MRLSTVSTNESTRIGLVGVEEAADFLGIRECTFYTWAAHGRVPHVRLGRALRFDMQRLKAWVRERSIEPSSGKLPCNP